MGFYFQDDFWESASLLPANQRGKLIEAIVVYWFTGEEIKMPDIVKASFISIRARLNRSKTNQMNASRKEPKQEFASTFAASETPSETNNDAQNSLLKREREREILTTSVVNKPPKPPTAEINEIVDYLNERTGKSYRGSSRKTISLISARLNEGFTVQDFKSVIDLKASQWQHDQKMERYLRPETLFGTKFEGYLNEQPRGGTSDEFDEYAARLS